MTSFNLILGGVSRALCQHRRAPRGRADGSFAPITETHSVKIRLPAPQSAAVVPPSGGWILGVSSLAKALREPVERLRTMLRAPAFFPRRRDQLSGFSDFCRRFGSGKPSLFRSLVQHPEKSGRSVFHALKVSPVPFVAAVHGNNHDSRSDRNVGKVVGEFGNV